VSASVGAESIEHTEMNGAFAAFDRLLSACSLYGSEHPATLEAAELAGELGAGPIREQLLGITAAGFVPIGSDKPIGGGRTLAKVLFEADLGAVELRSRLGAKRALRLAGVVSVLGSAAKDPEHLAEQLGSATAGAVRFHAVDLTGVRLSDGGPAGRRPTVLGLLLDRRRPASNAADGAAARICSGGDREVAKIREELAHAARLAEREQPGGVTRERLGSFLSALDPQTRRALTAIPVERPGEWMPVLSGLIGAVSVAEVIESLERVDRSQRAPSRAALLLFTRLASVAGGDARSRARVATLAGEWAEAPATTGREEAGLLSSLADLLGSDSGEEYSEADYDGLLDDISSAVESAAPVVALSDVTDPISAAVRACEIAGDLARAEDADSADHARALDRAIACAGLGEYEAAARLADDSAAARDRIISALDSTEHLTRLACDAAAARSDPRREAAIALIRALGERGVRGVLRVMIEGDADHAERLADLAAGAGLEPLLTCITGLLGDPTFEPVSIERVLRRLPVPLVRDRVQHALDSTDPDARRRGFLLLAYSGGDWPHDLIKAALSDENEAVRRAGLQGLFERTGKSRNELLARFIEGRLARRVSRGEVRDVIACLSDMPGAPERLALALSRLTGNPAAGLDGRLRTLVGELETMREHQAVRRILRTWRLRPGGMLDLLLHAVVRKDAQ